METIFLLISEELDESSAEQVQESIEALVEEAYNIHAEDTEEDLIDEEPIGYMDNFSDEGEI
jgi:hypothetical protein